MTLMTDSRYYDPDPPAVATRRCHDCGEGKPVGDFGRTKTECRVCLRAKYHRHGAPNPRGKVCKGCEIRKPYSEYRAVTAARCAGCEVGIESLEQIRNPLGFARKFLASRGLLTGGQDDEELMDVAIESIVTAALSWVPSGGANLSTWAYRAMDRDVARAVKRLARQRSELGRAECVTTSDEWLDGHCRRFEFDRVEMRVDLQRWADLAELSDFQRFIVEYFANHHGVYVRDTPLAGRRSPLNGSGSGSLKLALKHMRRAAVTNQRRDDRWTRRRDQSGLEAKSRAAVEFWRDEQNRPLVDRTGVA